jgi:hypothetical protein
MTINAINTHIKSIYTNTELGSKHTRQNMLILFEKKCINIVFNNQKQLIIYQNDRNK